MTTKEFYKEYTKLVIPIMLQGLVTTLVAMVDNLMVGQLGDAIIAAVSISNRILGIVMFTLFGIAGASGVFIAQFYGAKDTQKQKEAFRTSIILSMCLLLVALFLFLVVPEHIVQFFITDATITVHAAAYLRWMIIGYIPYILTINYATALKVIGQVRLPLVASLVGVFVNAVGNYLLIFGHFGFWELGIQGAAIATVLARFIEFALIYLVVLRANYSFNTRFTEIFRVDSAIFKQVCQKAVPLAINEVIWAFGQATLLKLYGYRGSHVVAALSISDTTVAIFYSIAQGVAAATPVLVSQRLGANRLDEAYSNAKRMVTTIVGVGMILGICLFQLSHVVPNLYHISELSHRLSVQIIQLTAFSFWVYLTSIQNYHIMRAGGDMKSTLLMDGGFKWLVTIPVMAFVAYWTDLPVVGMFMVSQVCDVLQLIVSSFFFLKKRWLKNLATVNHTKEQLE